MMPAEWVGERREGTCKVGGERREGCLQGGWGREERAPARWVGEQKGGVPVGWMRREQTAACRWVGKKSEGCLQGGWGRERVSCPRVARSIEGCWLCPFKGCMGERQKSQQVGWRGRRPTSLLPATFPKIQWIRVPEPCLK